VQAIRVLYPDLEVKATRLVGEGESNDVLVVNDALVFRFPRTPDGVACLRLAEQLATFARELHGVPARAVELELPRKDHGRDSGLPGLYETVRERLYPHMRPDARERVTARFDAYLDDPSRYAYEPVIVHGDLGPGNILLDPDTRTVSGILDFGSAGLDDPAVDLGHLSFWGERLLGRRFVGQLYRRYPVAEPLLSRVRFYAVMIAMVVALEGLANEDREAYEFGLAQYV
jgi:aminoglycoside 2''-phosphotransferase